MTPSKIFAPMAALGLVLAPVAAQAEGDVLRAPAPVDAAEGMGGDGGGLILAGFILALTVFIAIVSDDDDDDVPVSP